jgi:hypothetical protein
MDRSRDHWEQRQSHSDDAETDPEMTLAPLQDVGSALRRVSGDDPRGSNPTVWDCLECGERLTVPPGATIIPVLTTCDTAEPQRVITVAGQVIHRCPA